MENMGDDVSVLRRRLDPLGQTNTAMIEVSLFGDFA
jgi:hypothetical protein